MSEAYIEVVDWPEHQHYKDRDPPWIKLHRKVLDNYKWSCLQDASKAHLVGIWLLAARHANHVPADPVWIGQRMSASEPVDLQALVNAGFIIVHDAVAQNASNVLAKGSLETEAYTSRTTTTSEEDAARETAPPLTEPKPPRKENKAQGRDTWVTPYADDWKAQYGGEMAIKKSVAPLAEVEKKLGPEETRVRWRIYLSQTPGRYASAARFAETPGEWGTSRPNGRERDPPRKEKARDPVSEHYGKLLEQSARNQE